ncbi:MAG: hypothetical protein J6X11_10450 [Treponema sp.]|nr:hypothetical protein [Treponema sp.]
MKKLLTFILVLGIVATSSLYAQAAKKKKTQTKTEEPDTVLVYGCTPWSVDNIYFIQTDSKLAPSFIKSRGDGYYYGEAVSGGSYKCTYSQITVYNTIYYGDYGLGLQSDFDFGVPKEKDKIIYLVYKNFDGKNVDEHYVDDIYMPFGKEIMQEKENIKKGELARRKRALVSMRIKYLHTKWEPLLLAELKRIEDLQEKLKNGEDIGDEE